MGKRAMVHHCTGMVKRAMIHTAGGAMAMQNKLLSTEFGSGSLCSKLVYCACA